MLIKYIYILFMGIILAVFVGVGIAAFYKGPKPPDYPPELSYPEVVKPGYETATPSAERIKLQREQDAKFKAFQKEDEIYNRNVSIIATISAIIMLVLSLTLVKQIQVLADGLLLGGVLSLGYAVVRGFGSNDDVFRFLVVTVGLIVALGLGYLKFVKNLSK